MGRFLVSQVAELWAWTAEQGGEGGVVGVLTDEGFRLLVGVDREPLEEEWVLEFVNKLSDMGATCKLSRFTLHDTVKMLGAS